MAAGSGLKARDWGRVPVFTSSSLFPSHKHHEVKIGAGKGSVFQVLLPRIASLDTHEEQMGGFTRHWCLGFFDGMRRGKFKDAISILTGWGSSVR